MKIKRCLKWIAVICIVFILTIGVPIIINEAYKSNSGYITMWGASDVLSYYGAVLGALIAVITLSVTILFTQKQIKRESYLNEEQAKWKQLEELSLQCIEKIDPTAPLRETMEVGQLDPFTSIRVFQQYQMTCRTATDYFLAYIGETEFNDLKELLQQISNTSEIYFGFAAKEIENYDNLRSFQGRNDAQKVLDVEKEAPNTFSAETIQYFRKIISDTEGITLDQIQSALRDTNQKMLSTYENYHRALLQVHRDTFNKTNEKIQEQADSILHLWRK